MDAAARVVRPGVTTDEIDAVVHEATIAAGMSKFYTLSIDLRNTILLLNKIFLFIYFSLTAFYFSLDVWYMFV